MWGVSNRAVVPPSGLKMKDVVPVQVTCFVLRDMSEVDAQKVSEPEAKNRSSETKIQAGTLDVQIESRPSSITPSDYPM